MDLLDLRLVQALSSQERDGVRIVKAEVLVQPVECLFCKAANPYRHDSREQEFADAGVVPGLVRQSTESEIGARKLAILQLDHCCDGNQRESV